MHDKQKAVEETIENWTEYNDRAEKLHQVLHAAEEMLPSDDVEKLSSTQLENQLQKAKVGHRKQSFPMHGDCICDINMNKGEIGSFSLHTSFIYKVPHLLTFYINDMDDCVHTIGIS